MLQGMCRLIGEGTRDYFSDAVSALGVVSLCSHGTLPVSSRKTEEYEEWNNASIFTSLLNE